MATNRISLGYSGAIETRLAFEDDHMLMEDHLPGKSVQAILDSNQAERNVTQVGRHLHKVGSVPLTELANWRRDWQQNHSDKWEWMTFCMMKLKDRDYSKFRTSDRKL